MEINVFLWNCIIARVLPLTSERKWVELFLISGLLRPPPRLETILHLDVLTKGKEVNRIHLNVARGNKMCLRDMSCCSWRFIV